MQGENSVLQTEQDLEAQRRQVLAELNEVDLEQQAIMTGQASLDEEAAQLEAAIKQLAKAEAELQQRKKQVQAQAVSIGDKRTEMLARKKQADLMRVQIEDAMQEVLNQAQAAQQVQAAPQVQPDAQQEPKASKADDELASQRSSPRANVVVDVAMHSDNNFFMGLTENLSEGGLFIATYDDISLGTELAVSLNLPEHKTIQTRGAVCWVREYTQYTKDLAPGVGVRFLDMAEVDQLAIREFIRRRDPILYDLG